MAIDPNKLLSSGISAGLRNLPPIGQGVNGRTGSLKTFTKPPVIPQAKPKQPSQAMLDALKQGPSIKPKAPPVPTPMIRQNQATKLASFANNKANWSNNMMTRDVTSVADTDWGQSVADLKATVAVKGDDLKTVRTKFPEFSHLNDTVVRDLMATANHYDDPMTVVSKFPELRQRNDIQLGDLSVTNEPSGGSIKANIARGNESNILDTINLPGRAIEKLDDLANEYLGPVDIEKRKKELGQRVANIPQTEVNKLREKRASSPFLRQSYKNADDYIIATRKKYTDEVLGVGDKDSMQVGQIIANIPGSTARLATGIGRATTNPIDTAVGIGKLAVNEAKAGYSAITGSEGPDSIIKDRYYTNLGKTISQDPAGVASDIMGAGAGVGKTVAKVGTKLGIQSEKLAKLGDFSTKLSSASDLGIPQAIDSGIGKLTNSSNKVARGVGNYIKYSTSPIEAMKLSKEMAKKIQPTETIANAWLKHKGAQGKLFQAQEPRTNQLNKSVDYGKLKENSAIANEEIIKQGYKPTDTTSRATAHAETMQKIRNNEIKAKVGEGFDIDLNPIADAIEQYAQEVAKAGIKKNETQLQDLIDQADAYRKMGVVDGAQGEIIKEYINTTIDNRGDSSLGDVYKNGMRKGGQALGKILDDTFSSIPGEFADAKRRFGALKSTYADVVKADIKNQKAKGMDITESFGRLEGVGEIAGAVFGTLTGKNPLPGLASGTAKLFLGKVMGKLKDKDYLIKSGYEELAKKMPKPPTLKPKPRLIKDLPSLKKLKKKSNATGKTISTTAGSEIFINPNTGKETNPNNIPYDRASYTASQKKDYINAVDDYNIANNRLDRVSEGRLATKNKEVQKIYNVAANMDKKSQSLYEEARKYKSAEEFVKAGDDLYRDTAIRWGGDNYREYIKDESFIDDFKRITQTHSEPISNFRKPSPTTMDIQYKDLLRYKKILPNDENAYIKTEQDALKWVKENKPDKLQDFLEEIEKAKEILKRRQDLEKNYIPFSIGYSDVNALREGITTRPLSVSYAGNSAYEGQKVVQQFGKNTGYVYINKNSYVLPIRGSKYADYEKELVIPIGSKIRHIDIGYTGFGTKQIGVFVDTPIETIQNLKQIYEQANSPQKTVKPKNLTPKKQSATMGDMETKKLIEEARKYKSAEEFVKAQGTPVYRTEKADIAYKGKSVWGDGKYFGIDKNQVKEITISPHSGKSTGGKVDEYVVPSNLKIKEIDISWEAMKPEDFNKFARGNDLKKQILNEGYDGVILKTDGDLNLGGDQLIMYKNADQIKTKSELTDIWNKHKK